MMSTPEPAGPPARTGASRPRVSGFPLIVFALLVAAAFVLAPNIHLLIAQQHQVAALSQQVQTAKQQLSALQSEQARWSDPAYIRSQTRSRLYFVTPGQTTYIALNVPTAPAAAASTSSRTTRTQGDWMSVLNDSVVSAGIGSKALTNK